MSESAARGENILIDRYIKDEILHYPTVDLIRMLFPDMDLRGRRVVRNPLRGEQHPSLSCFFDSTGHARWKDHATGETGDNIDLIRLVFPDLDYLGAVDRLSMLICGRPALGTSVTAGYMPPARPRVSLSQYREPEPALRPVLVLPFGNSDVPAALREYVAGRGISPSVANRFLSYVRYVNVNTKGKPVIDHSTGFPLCDRNGDIVLNDGISDAVGLCNGIGGFALRVPQSPTCRGFKGTDKSFISVIPSGGTPVPRRVSWFGDDCMVSGAFYDTASERLFVNGTSGFAGVPSGASSFAYSLIESKRGLALRGRELAGCISILDALCLPLTGRAYVVEGMFDALSLIELELMSGNTRTPVHDIVVLNSLSNAKWAAPFLASRGEVVMLLDNDMRSGAGEKTFKSLSEEITSISETVRARFSIRSASAEFAPCKDLNEYLMRFKGIAKHEKKKNNVGSRLKKGLSV